ncbi:alpha-2-macroglobulin [Thermoproteota archaeon]
MKTIYKSFALGLALLFLSGSLCFAADIKKADDLFEKGTFQEALKEYEALSKEARDPELRFKAFYRSIECLGHLFRYGDAVQKISEAPIPTKMPNQARFLILKAGLFRNFLQQYGHFQRKDVIDDDQEDDVFRLTPEEIKDEINKTYQELWKIRKKLINYDIKKEEYYLDIKDIDFGMHPTLFDYLIQSWTDFFLNTNTLGFVMKVGETQPKAELLLVEDFKYPVNLEDFWSLLTAELMEEASRFGKKDRLEASERWKIRRLLLPLKCIGFILKDPNSYRDNAKGILLRWMNTFKTSEAKAEAGYQAAVILNSIGKVFDTVKLCKKIEKEFSGTNSSERAKVLRIGIEMPQLSLQANNVVPPAKDAFIVTTKNIKDVYFRFYKMDPNELRNEYTSFYKRGRQEGWSRIFNQQDPKFIKELLRGKVPYKEWKFRTEDRGEYRRLAKTVSPPSLETDIYLVLACADRSFKIGSSLMSACFFNVTDFVLIGTAGFTTNTQDAYYDFIDNMGPDGIVDEGYRFYTLDAKTGKPVKGVALNVYVNENYRSRRQVLDLTADRQGVASLSLPVKVFPNTSNHSTIDPLATHNNAFSYWRNQQYVSYTAPNPIMLFIETDRPIYRPGHTLQAKVVVVRKQPMGFRSLGSNQGVTFSAQDPNGKEFFNKVVKLSEFGSAKVSFEVPQGRILGRYSLRAHCKDGRFRNSTSTNFSVEEYKRPDFEVILKPAAMPWKYNEPVSIEGEAKYYFGGPVPNAPIKYRIKWQSYIPWCYRYFFQHNYYGGGGQEIATGEVRTDDEGKFVIGFTPTPRGSHGQNIPDISQFTVEVEGHDSGGRTIESSQSYKAGKNAIYFVIEPKKGFFLEREEIEIGSQRLTINDAPAEGKSTYEIFLLKGTPSKTLSHKGYWGWVAPLDVQLKDIPNGKLVAQGEIQHDKDGKGVIEISKLPQGTYRIVQKSLDQWQEEVEQVKIFVVARDIRTPVPVNAPSVTLLEKDEYEIGDVARFVIGSALARGVYHVELWAGEHLIRHELIDSNKPVRLIEIPVTEKMKGGFTLRWFGVKDFQAYHGQIGVSVPWKEKKLKLSLKPFNNELVPGQEVKWGINVEDANNTPVEAEVLAFMYDRSLEYYAKAHSAWLDNLYQMRMTSIRATDSTFDPYFYNIPITEGLLEKLLKAFRTRPKEPRIPSLRSWRTWAHGGSWGSLGSKGAYFGMVSEDASDKVAYASVSARGLESKARSFIDRSSQSDLNGLDGTEFFRSEEAAKKVETRKAFADTAFFKPHIVTLKDGKAFFSFTAPEQLTSWRVKAFAFTKDIKEGVLTQEAVTRKDLMVRADLPRFFREKDKGTVTAIVHNESEDTLEGELFIEIKENGKLIHQKIKLEQDKKKFSVEPHSLATYNWMIEIPTGVTTYKVRVVAVSSELSDAEEKELPILPSRERLIESALISLSGNETKKLEILLKKDPTRINESMVLQVDPQLALSIINTIPFLIEYPHECVEQILNKFVPLSIVNEIYKKYPTIQKAVAKIPKRKTTTPAWDKSDPNRLITLMETPWVWQSEGRPVSCPIIDLFDPKIVKVQKENKFAKLKSAQLSNGGFPWWPGGKADPYMTLYVLDGFAQARRYGVQIPRDIIQRALRYVNKEIPLLLKAEERYLSIVAYAAYVVTSYPEKDFPEAKAGHDAARSWVQYLDRHIHALTPFGKAYLSFTYLRLGDRQKAESILDMAMDGAREDPIAGVYWTPEKYSWVWYSDTVEKHAFFLRTLQELRPNDKRIAGMVQWLLFNRKGNVWKSTKASVAAVYALLDYLNQRGALASDESFNIKWSGDTQSVLVKADDWLDEPIRLQKKEVEISAGDNKAVIEKKGPGIAFASMTWIYSTDQIPDASTPGMLELKRRFYLRVKEGDAYHLKPIQSGDSVSVGDQIEVQLKINTRSQFEYMHLKDPKASGFEAEALLSGWKYDPLSFYEEPRDSLTNFFMSWLPHGEYILRYRLKPTKPGVYRIGAATLQSMYAPDMTAHSAGFIIKVRED